MIAQLHGVLQEEVTTGRFTREVQVEATTGRFSKEVEVKVATTTQCH
jgi:hypothetical protein